MTDVGTARVMRALSEMQDESSERLAVQYPTLAAALADLQYEQGLRPVRALRIAHQAAGYGR